MAFGMFSAQVSPIAIDFGSSSVKLLQSSSGERPALVAAAELPVPDSIRAEPERVLEFHAEWLPKVMRDAQFKGRRALIAIPAAQTFTQHMAVADTEGLSREDAMKGQLQVQMGCSPSSVVVRSLEVCPTHRNGQSRTEMICLAIAKDTVMKYVELLSKCKLEVVGVHTEIMAIARAFEYLSADPQHAKLTTILIDIGWGGTRVAITHDTKLAFARYIAVGGRNLDHVIAAKLKCDMCTARSHRLSVMAGGSGSQAGADRAAPATSAQTTAVCAAGRSTATMTLEKLATTGRGGRAGQAESSKDVDLSEVIATLLDELQMCVRYHQSLFRGTPIDRVIFAGGESRQPWLCQRIVDALHLPAQLGNPLARLEDVGITVTPNLDMRQPQPAWAVACGLSNAPADL